MWILDSLHFWPLMLSSVKWGWWHQLHGAAVITNDDAMKTLSQNMHTIKFQWMFEVILAFWLDDWLWTLSSCERKRQTKPAFWCLSGVFYLFIYLFIFRKNRGFYLFFPFIFISWRLITLQYCSGFCLVSLFIMALISHWGPPTLTTSAKATYLPMSHHLKVLGLQYMQLRTVGQFSP